MVYQYHSFTEEFYQSYYTQHTPPPQKKKKSIAKIKNSPQSLYTQEKVETFYYLEREVESDRRVIWNTAAPITSQVTTFLNNCTLPPQ